MCLHNLWLPKPKFRIFFFFCKLCYNVSFPSRHDIRWLTVLNLHNFICWGQHKKEEVKTHVLWFPLERLAGFVSSFDKLAGSWSDVLPSLTLLVIHSRRAAKRIPIIDNTRNSQQIRWLMRNLRVPRAIYSNEGHKIDVFLFRMMFSPRFFSWNHTFREGLGTVPWKMHFWLIIGFFDTKNESLPRYCKKLYLFATYIYESVFSSKPIWQKKTKHFCHWNCCTIETAALREIFWSKKLIF